MYVQPQRSGLYGLALLAYNIVLAVENFVHALHGVLVNKFGSVWLS